jgi:transposase-like protein
MGTRNQFTPEFKREAVQLLEGGSRSASELARELGGTAQSTLQVVNRTTGAWEYGVSRSWGPQGTDDRGGPSEA